MAQSTGPILAAGALTFFNKWIVQNRGFDLKIPVATGASAMLLAGIEAGNRELAVGLSWIILVTVMFVRPDAKTPSPLESILGYIR